VAALQTLTLRLTCAGGRGGGVHRGCRRRARRCLVVRGRHCVRCALLPSARAHTHAALAFRWIAVRESGALRQLVASKTRPCLSTKLHVVSTDPEKSSSLGPMLSSHAGARCGIITGTMQLPGHDAQGTEVECSLSDDLTVRSPTRACRRPCARGVGVVAYPGGLKAATSKADPRQHQDWFCRVGEPFLSRPVGWKRFGAALNRAAGNLSPNLSSLARPGEHNRRRRWTGWPSTWVR
jgi:hypothetical protein